MPYVWPVCPGLPPPDPPAHHVSANLLTHTRQLIIPKYHGEKLVDIPDEHLTELLVRVTHPSRVLLSGFTVSVNSHYVRSPSRRRSQSRPAQRTTTSCRTTARLPTRRLDT